jgi:DNA-binding CsgD family transcriptional regulator
VLYRTVCGIPVVRDVDGQAEEDTYLSKIRVGWAKEDPVFRRVFTTRFIPDATEEQMRWFDELQRMSTSPENAAASRIGRQQVDIADDLDRITTPTLVLQATGDRSMSFDNAVEVTTRIPGSRLVALNSNNHILLEGEPAWATFVDEVTGFLEPDRRAWTEHDRDGSIETLSPRELDVLRACADGATNEAIATELGLSPRTVERHLSNVYLKLGLSGPAARAGAVARYLRRA